jgi:hypothetical protein
LATPNGRHSAYLARRQAETPLIVLSRFSRRVLTPRITWAETQVLGRGETGVPASGMSQINSPLTVKPPRLPQT